MEIGSEAKEALEAGQPVVALESTVLAHGLPRPRNLEVGRALEAKVRTAGATPATVAVVRGVPRVGLSQPQLELIAAGDGVAKLSTRDLPVAMARGDHGATTVAATMWIARRAGIGVFATGGVGGVHRGVPRDVSADVVELARTPMIVVCSGAKSILDLAETREALESAGVLVAGWRTDEMPAFYSGSSGLAVDVRVDSADDAAAVWAAHRRIGSLGAMLLCVPPPPSDALPSAEVEAAIRHALARAAESRISGKQLTPFLLAAVGEATGGRSLDTNVALLLNNAGIAAAVATAVGR
jgi:pseudouridine-5'-phosphate glycosidase